MEFDLMYTRRIYIIWYWIKYIQDMPQTLNSQTLILSKNFWKLIFLSSHSENLNDFVDAPLVTVGVIGVWNDGM